MNRVADLSPSAGRMKLVILDRDGTINADSVTTS
jgi:histidinol phosphatase-like enzyme